MKLIVGLGNPGNQYTSTRHNAGFMVLDLLAQRLGLAFDKLERRADDGSRTFSGKVKAKVCEGRRKGREFLLVKPQSYVNLSGDVAAPLLRHASLKPASLFVVVDDLNLPLGRMRIRPSGSAGGHNGLKSIQERLGSDGYPRLRLGIGPPDAQGDGSEGPRPADWPDFVLAPFLPEEREVLGRVLGLAADCVQAWIDGQDLTTLMGTYNGLGASGGEPRKRARDPDESGPR